MEKKGFVNNGSKKLFRKESGNCAYVYTDGVVLRETRTCKSGKQTFKKSFTHIFPCKIPIYITNRRSEYERIFIGRLVVHNPSLLIDGIDRIEIYFNNSSQSSREKGIYMDTVILKTQNGMEIKENILPFLSSDVVIQNESKQSIMAWDTLDGDTIWHGEKPTAEITE